MDLFTLEKKRLSGGWEGILLLSSITQRRIIETMELDSSQISKVECKGSQQRMFWLDIWKMYSPERGTTLERVPREAAESP